MNRGFDHYSPLARDEGLYSYGEWRAALAATPTPRAEHEIESCRPETRASLCCALPGFYSRPLQSTVATSAWLLAACWLLPTCRYRRGSQQGARLRSHQPAAHGRGTRTASSWRLDYPGTSAAAPTAYGGSGAASRVPPRGAGGPERRRPV
jgi:hypothetical protein